MKLEAPGQTLRFKTSEEIAAEAPAWGKVQPAPDVPGAQPKMKSIEVREHIGSETIPEQVTLAQSVNHCLERVPVGRPEVL